MSAPMTPCFRHANSVHSASLVSRAVSRFHGEKKTDFGIAQAVFAEGKEHALAVGQMKMSTTDVYVKPEFYLRRTAFESF